MLFPVGQRFCFCTFSEQFALTVTRRMNTHRSEQGGCHDLALTHPLDDYSAFLCLPENPEFSLYRLYCLNPGKSRVRAVQNQQGHHGGLLKLHYTSPHHLQAQLAVKPFICTSTSGI